MLLACLFSAATPSSSVKLLVSRETLQCLGCLLKLCSGGWFVLLASVKRVLVLVFFFSSKHVLVFLSLLCFNIGSRARREGWPVPVRKC